MVKIKKFDETEPNGSTVLQPEPSAAPVEGHAGVQKQDGRTDGEQDKSADGRLLIHVLTVERYREIYNSVLNPAALAALKTCKASDYVCQVQELKQQLWLKLGRPQLQETLTEDGQVVFTELLDLT